MTVTCSQLLAGPLNSKFLFKLASLVFSILLPATGFCVLVKNVQNRVDVNAREQDEFLGAFAPRYLDVAVLSAAALSVFLELAIIRWQGTVFEFFAFYKNFSLLSCFAGLGLGYALADRRCAATIAVREAMFGMSRQQVGDDVSAQAHLHVEFYPILRDRGKLKYLAGSESGAGVFINDTLAEESADRLRGLLE